MGFLGTIVISLITGIISGCISGVVVTKHYRRKDERHAKTERRQSIYYAWFNHLNNLMLNNYGEDKIDIESICNTWDIGSDDSALMKELLFLSSELKSGNHSQMNYDRIFKALSELHAWATKEKFIKLERKDKGWN